MFVAMARVVEDTSSCEVGDWLILLFLSLVLAAGWETVNRNLGAAA